MNLADIIIGCVIIAILVVSGTSIFGAVKDHLVDAENCYQANKFSAETLEDLKVLLYSDPALEVNTIPVVPYDRPLDACRLRDICGGTRSYVVNQRFWDEAESGTTYDYKEIIVTTRWTHKGQDKSVSLGIFRRNDD